MAWEPGSVERLDCLGRIQAGTLKLEGRCLKTGFVLRTWKLLWRVEVRGMAGMGCEAERVRGVFDLGIRILSPFYGQCEQMACKDRLLRTYLAQRIHFGRPRSHFRFLSLHALHDSVGCLCGSEVIIAGWI